jgi:hypothetical protein
MLKAEKCVWSSMVDLFADIGGMPAKSPIIATLTILPQPPGPMAVVRGVTKNYSDLNGTVDIVDICIDLDIDNIDRCAR